MQNVRYLKSIYLNPFVYIYDIYTKKKLYLGHLDECPEEIEEGAVKATLSRQSGTIIIIEIGIETPNNQKKKRKYYRKCGCCGARYEQSEMIRTLHTDSGWICRDCFDEINEDYDDSIKYELT